MANQLTLEELGPLEPCVNCGEPTYSPANLPEGSSFKLLPAGFTTNRRRKIINYHNKDIVLCERCRYESFYRRY